MDNHTGFWVKILFVGILIVGGSGLYFFDPGKQTMKIVGIARWSSHPEFGRSVYGFKQGLAENGFVEGENVRFISKNPKTDLEKQHQIIKEFIATKVDLIYSLTTPGTLIAKRETSKMSNPIPVVFSICAYPVESNLIASLESSGNNLVGTRNHVPFSQQYYSFEKIFPNTKTLAVVYHKGDHSSKNQLKEVKNVLRKRGIRVVSIAAVDHADIRRQLDVSKAKIDAIFATCDTIAQTGGDEIMLEFGNVHKKPSFSCSKGGVFKGHLIGNVGDFKAIGKIAGEKAALILKGSKPTWLTTEALRENYIVINKKTADSMGLTIPKELVEIAKEIITQ